MATRTGTQQPQPQYMTRAQREANRRRATARQRALSRLAREHAPRYRQLYREELGGLS
jgi:hypothetical protein